MTTPDSVSPCELQHSATVHGSERTLPQVKFITGNLPLHERTSAWQDISSSLFHVEPIEQALEGTINAFMLSDWLVGSICCNAHRYFREPLSSTSDGLDYFFVQYYQQGRLKGRCGQTELDIQPGDLCFIDMRQGLDLTATRMLTHTLVIPRHEFGIDLATADLHGTVISGNTPIGSLLGNHIRTLVDMLPHLTMQDSKQIKSCTRSLLMAWLDTMSNRSNRHASTLRGLKQQLHAYIDEHLTESSLGPMTLQQEFNIARTTLYRAFGKPGVSDYIRDRRLEEALREIRRENSMPVSQIAFQWGFTTERSFQRAFRNRYGMSPTQARQHPVDLLQMHSPLVALQDTMAYWAERGESSWAS